MAFLIGGANSAAADTGFEVENSVRFNDDDEAYLHKTPGSAGNSGQKIYTFSTWVKRCAIGTEQVLLRTKDGSNVENVMRFNSGGQLLLYAAGGAANLSTSAVYRDPGAWMNVIYAVDTTQGTASDRIKLYVNGTRVTAFGTETYPSANVDMKICDATMHIIGRVWNDAGAGGDADYYLAETILIDGTQYAASDFGEFDDDSPRIWKPIESVEDLTFGTNGFYLNYKDSANLGNDANGGTDFTEVNIAAVDQASDTPTNNFCTWNPLSVNEMTFTEGNCVATSNSNPRTDDNCRGTMGVQGGKWYWEIKSTGDSIPGVAGICDDDLKMGDDLSGEAGVYAIQNAGGTYAYRRENGTTAETTGFPNPTNGQIFNMAFDADNAKLYVGINGSYYSQDGSDGDPAGGSNETYASIDTSRHWLPFFEARGTAQNAQGNFGGCPGFAISSGNADANGYGNFEYAVPSGYYALCTKNLAEYG